MEAVKKWIAEQQVKLKKQQVKFPKENVHQINNPNPTPAELKQFATEIALMKARAGGMGLYKTMHALEPATQAVGWEIAEMIERKSNTLKSDVNQTDEEGK
jgi:hypothetical protein